MIDVRQNGTDFASLRQAPDVRVTYHNETWVGCTRRCVQPGEGGLLRKMNVAVSGLTAAGKTTHALLLSGDLGYRYISATEIIAEMVGLDRNIVRNGFWEDYGDAIQKIRDTSDLDRKLDERLIKIATTDEGLVIDAWALPWLVSPQKCIHVWLESDHNSRTMKAAVSNENRQRSNWYGEFISKKDDDSRKRFLAIYGFDLYGRRDHFTIQLDNSSYITKPTRENSDQGIAQFHPILRQSVRKHLGFLLVSIIRILQGESHDKTRRSQA